MFTPAERRRILAVENKVLKQIAEVRRIIISLLSVQTRRASVGAPRAGVGAFVGEEVMRCVGAEVAEESAGLKAMRLVVEKKRAEYFASMNAPLAVDSKGKPKKDSRAAITLKLKRELDKLEKELNLRADNEAITLENNARRAEAEYATIAAQIKIKTLNQSADALLLNSTTTSTADPSVAPDTGAIGTPSPDAPASTFNWKLWAGGAALIGVGFFLLKRKRK